MSKYLNYCTVDDLDEDFNSQEPNDWGEKIIVKPRSLKLKFIAVALASLVYFYYADNAVANDITSGTAEDEYISLSWEYDLEHSTGQIVVVNKALTRFDWDILYFAGLIPGIEPWRFDTCDDPGFDISIRPYQSVRDHNQPSNIYDGVVCGDIPERAGFVIDMDLGNSPEGYKLEVADVIYGRDYLCPTSCAVPGVYPLGTINNFLKITPIVEEECCLGDANCDGEINIDDMREVVDHFGEFCSMPGLSNLNCLNS